MGYSVDVLVDKQNVCKTKAQLLSVAKGLRVNLNSSRVQLVHVVNDRTSLRLRGESKPMVRLPQPPSCKKVLVSSGAAADLMPCYTGAWRQVLGLYVAGQRQDSPRPGHWPRQLLHVPVPI